jgi:hypothetical protein
MARGREDRETRAALAQRGGGGGASGGLAGRRFFDDDGDGNSSSLSTREGAPWRLCLLVESLLSGKDEERRDLSAAGVGERDARGREERARRDDCDDDDDTVAAEF